MMEIGRVINIEGERISLALEKDAACGSCSIAGRDGQLGCYACSPLVKRVKTVSALNTHHLTLDVGDRVEVYLSPKKAVLAAFVIFILPLVSFFCVYAAVSLIAPLLDEGIRILGGIIGLAAVYLVYFLSRLAGRAKDWPEIVSKCEPVTGQETESAGN